MEGQDIIDLMDILSLNQVTTIEVGLESRVIPHVKEARIYGEMLLGTIDGRVFAVDILSVVTIRAED